MTTEAGRGGRGEPANPPRAARGVRARPPGPDARAAVARSRGRAVERSRASAGPARRRNDRSHGGFFRRCGVRRRIPVQHAPPPTVSRRPPPRGSRPCRRRRRARCAVRADERLASPRRSSRRASSNSAARGRSRRRNRERSASACFSSRAFPTAGAFGGRDFAVTSERRSPSSLSARRMIETASARSEQSALSFHRANEGPLDRTRVESRRSNHQSTFGYFEYYCRGYSATPLRCLIRRLSDAPDVFLRSPRSPRSSARAPRRRVPPARPPPGNPSRSPLEAASLAGPRRTSPRLTNDRIKRVRPRNHHPRAPTTPRRDDDDRMPLPSSPPRLPPRAYAAALRNAPSPRPAPPPLAANATRPMTSKTRNGTPRRLAARATRATCGQATRERELDGSSRAQTGDRVKGLVDVRPRVHALERPERRRRRTAAAAAGSSSPARGVPAVAPRSSSRGGLSRPLVEEGVRAAQAAARAAAVAPAAPVLHDDRRRAAVVAVSAVRAPAPGALAVAVVVGAMMVRGAARVRARGGARRGRAAAGRGVARGGVARGGVARARALATEEPEALHGGRGEWRARRGISAGNGARGSGAVIANRRRRTLIRRGRRRTDEPVSSF